MPTSRLSQRNPQMAAQVQRLANELHPFLRIIGEDPMDSGNLIMESPHPDFPRYMLNYILIGEQELDDMMHYYGQSTPDAMTERYPTVSNWNSHWLATLPTPKRVAIKRRKFGKFIGFRKHDTPRREHHEQLAWELEERLYQFENNRRVECPKVDHFRRW